MTWRYTLKGKQRHTIAVDETTLILLKHYARQKGITIVQATFILLREALAEAAGVELEASDE